MGDLYNPFPKLPKNIRQIGDPDQVIRFYMEDYVNTYLKRLYPSGSQTLRVGLLLGSVEQYDGTPYVFVDGAMEMEDVETDGEKIVFTESGWKKAYQAMEEAFPKRTIQGWFLCGGPGSQLSPLNYWKQHCQYFAGKNQLMYLNHGLEGEEVIYVTSEDGFYRLKGHCVYYERNQMMQDYMITRKDVRRVETGSHEKVIRDFRQRMVVKKEQADMESHKTSALGMPVSYTHLDVDTDGMNYLAGQTVDFVNKSAMNGTILAHTDGNVPNLMVKIPSQDAYSLGQLFYFFEFACGVSGYLLGVNPFNQPGVESYKKNMFALLGKPGYEEAREALLKRL